MTTNTPASEVPWTETPWTLCNLGDYGDYDGNCRVILGEGGDKRIAVVLGFDEESEATAKLMFESPTMAALLERIVTRGIGGSDVREIHEILNRIRSVK